MKQTLERCQICGKGKKARDSDAHNPDQGHAPAYQLSERCMRLRGLKARHLRHETIAYSQIQKGEQGAQACQCGEHAEPRLSQPWKRYAKRNEKTCQPDGTGHHAGDEGQPCTALPLHCAMRLSVGPCLVHQCSPLRMKIESPLFRTAGLARTESGLPRVLAQTPAVPSTRHVLVVGLARNVAACLRTTVHRLARAITPQAQSVQWLVIESDSSDETVRELASLERDLPDFRFISLGTLSLTIPLRTARIALCRNQYLSAIRQDARYRHVAAVVVADLDGVCDLLTPAAFASCWVRDDWDACMANQRGPYYDIWALRHPLWSPWLKTRPGSRWSRPLVVLPSTGAMRCSKATIGGSMRTVPKCVSMCRCTRRCARPARVSTSTRAW